jgi:23S rRNA pseudouridine2605 synthase
MTMTSPKDDAQAHPVPAGAREEALDPEALEHADVPVSLEDVVSGEFDADQADDAPVQHKRVLPPQEDMPKLHKVLAQAGVGSRLEMERLIQEGRVSVNNEPAHVGQRIKFGDTVRVGGKPIRVQISPPPMRVLAYHKPVGEVVTHDDPQNRPTVFRRLPRLQQGKWQSVGRLDLNTEGLLLFSNSGQLANQLMHPRFGLEREYAVRVLGALSDESRERLLSGVQLEDGPAQFLSLNEGGGEGANCWYRVRIAEGRNREVRRLFEAVGHAVSRLIRIRYGSVMLPRGLRRGTWIELSHRDVAQLAAAVGLEAEQAEARRPGTKGPGRAPGRPTGRAPNARAKTGRVPRPELDAQPDPLRTSVGYIGADSVSQQRKAKRVARKRFKR